MNEVKIPENLEDLVKLARKVGIKSMKVGGLEFTLTDAEPLKALTPYKKKKLEQSEGGLPDTFNEEETLFWSSAGIPAEKEQIANG